MTCKLDDLAIKNDDFPYLNTSSPRGKLVYNWLNGWIYDGILSEISEFYWIDIGISARNIDGNLIMYGF